LQAACTAFKLPHVRLVRTAYSIACHVGQNSTFAGAGLDALNLFYITMLGSAASYGVFFYNASRGNLTALSSLTFLTPMFAAGTGFLLLGETLTPSQARFYPGPWPASDPDGHVTPGFGCPSLTCSLPLSSGLLQADDVCIVPSEERPAACGPLEHHAVVDAATLSPATSCSTNVGLCSAVIYAWLAVCLGKAEVNSAVVSCPQLAGATVTLGAVGLLNSSASHVGKDGGDA